MEKILQRLKKVKWSGTNQAMACCPAHEDKTPSLSIKDIGGGKILINCLAGCATEDVLSSIGLDWDDVMPEKTTHHRLKPTKDRVYATDALKAIRYEAQIVMLCAFDMEKGREISKEDRERLKLSVERINTALEMANVD
jgi:hypothetical protein